MSASRSFELGGIAELSSTSTAPGFPSIAAADSRSSSGEVLGTRPLKYQQGCRVIGGAGTATRCVFSSPANHFPRAVGHTVLLAFLQTEGSRNWPGYCQLCNGDLRDLTPRDSSGYAIRPLDSPYARGRFNKMTLTFFVIPQFSLGQSLSESVRAAVVNG